MVHKVNLFLLAGSPKQGLCLVEKLYSEHKHQIGNICVGLLMECKEVQKKLEELGAKVHMIKHIKEDEFIKGLKECNKALILPSYELDNFETTVNVLKCIEKAQIPCVGMTTWMGAEHAQGKHLKCFYELEQQLKQCKIKCKCIKRLEYFQQELRLQAPAMQNDGVIVLATGEQEFRPVCCNDITCALAILLTKHEHKEGEECYNFYGPDKVTGQDTARMASKVIGTEYKFKNASREECKKYLKMNEGVNENKLETILDYFDVVREGKIKYGKNHLEELIKEPTSLKKFFEKNVDYFKPNQ